MEPRRRIISLRGQPPLRSDEKLLTFAHPDYEDRIIKVVNPHLSNWPNRNKWRFFRAVRARSQLTRELRRYEALARDEPRRPRFVQRLFGTVPTDFGRGLVAERLADAKDRAAPTLRVLVRRQGLTPEIREAVSRFIGEITQRDLSIGELNVNNLVYVADKRGGARLVLVDGLAGKTLIPLAEANPALNRSLRHRKIERLMAALTALDENRGGAPRKPQTA